MERTTLYKRDARNNVLMWKITKLTDTKLSIDYGIYGKTIHNEAINTTKTKVDEYQSRINAKRKEGYKSLEDLYDNSPVKIDNEKNKLNYLLAYLPKYNTTSDGFILPMLAKTLEDNKPFEKFGIMHGQWKINGLRCLVGAEKLEGDLFKSVRLTYTSREGTKWNLEWMDDIILPKLDYDIIEAMIDENACLDGELYLPGYSVNDINSFVKNKDLPQHYMLQYWCYDIAIENMSAVGRYSFRNRHIDLNISTINTRDGHLHNIEQFVLLPATPVSSFQDAIEHRNDFILYGFEGLILRDPNAEYAFGKRNSSMFKFKKKLDGMFVIKDIKEDKRGLPIFVLANDINEELFECTINVPHDIQIMYLHSKEHIIGKSGLVEYRERSGVKQVPFHAKLIKIMI